VKPYRFLAIEECFEELGSIPSDSFVFETPPPYMALGAPYGESSPWMLRSDVLARLQKALEYLNEIKPGWLIKIFDAYRPNSVQAYMVEREFMRLSNGQPPQALSESARKRISDRVYRIWAIPSDDPTTPPPHSTGAAIDLTLIDESGCEVDMGSPIDENSDRSNPDYFVEIDPVIHQHRDLLRRVMVHAGFIRHDEEWWHFSYGDQMWAWHTQREQSVRVAARYGRADLL